MTSRTENARKRKEKPEAVVSSGSDDGDRSKQRKARRVSTDTAAAPAASLRVDTPVVTEENTAVSTASTVTEDKESIQSIGKLIQSLFHSDNAKVNAALDELCLNVHEDKKKCDKIQAVGGCHALVQLLKNCLDKAIDKIPACDQVTELNELAELTTLHKTLRVITNLTFQHDESKIGIAAIGGVEAVVKVIKTFPKCEVMQDFCAALRNLTCCSLGKTNAIDSGGIEVLLAAVSNHMGSASVCHNACGALVNFVKDSKESVGRLITLGGGSALAKVRTKWPDNNDVQTEVRELANLIVAEMKAW
jgi:hypothetical protein